MHWTIIVLVYMIKRGILRYPASHLSIVKFLLLSRRSFFENLKIIRYEKRNMKCAKHKNFKSFSLSSDSFNLMKY